MKNDKIKILKEMLCKTHLAFGKDLFFDSYTLAPKNDWDLLPASRKEHYCKKASQLAGIDHKKYLEIMKEKIE